MEDISKEIKKESIDVLWVRWKCLNCGYTYEGFNKALKCPKCFNEDPDKFADVD